MRYGYLSGVKKPVSRLILGTSSLLDTGGCLHAILDDAYSIGYNAFDTARIYDNGRNERSLGEWIERRRVRDCAVIITKGGHPGPTWKPRLTRADLIEDICASAEALKVSTIDVFLLHRDDPAVPVGEVIETLNEMIGRQKISAFGASNWSAKRIEAAQSFASRNRLQGFCASSPHVSLANWVHEPWPGCVSLAGQHQRDEKRWYMEQQFPVLAWSPLAGGFLSGSNGDHSLGPTRNYSPYSSTGNLEKLKRAAVIGSRRHATVAQIALAYLFSQPMDIYCIVSSTQLCHLQSNMAALDITLSRAECCWLELQSEAQQVDEFSQMF